MEREPTIPGEADPPPPGYTEPDPALPPNKAGYVDPTQPGQPSYPPPGYMQQQQGYMQPQQQQQQQQQQQPIYAIPASQQYASYPPPLGQPQPGYNQQPVYNQQPQPAPINIAVVNTSNVIQQQQQQQQQQQGGGYGIFIAKPANYLGLAIWVLICWNWPLGIVAIVFACLSTTSYDEGDIQAARSRGKISLYISISGILSAVLIIIIIIASSVA